MTPARLDRFIPRPDVRKRFETTVRAPADVVMEVAVNFDMQSLPTVKAILRLREVLLGSHATARRPAQGILDETTQLGWRVLDQQPGRFVICGATCQPWLADVTFSGLSPNEFERYAEPDEVKIAWTLEADEVAPELTRFAHETRAVATDDASRRKFARYWRWARFGIIAIRLFLLPAIRGEAERRWAMDRGRGPA